MKRTCESCSGPYEAVRSNARFCSERCKKRAQRGHLAQVPTVLAAGTPAGTALVTAITQELEAAGRLDSALGQATLALAQRIEAGQDTGSAVAALSREMRGTLAEALKGAVQAQSTLGQRKDELAARRARGA